MGTKVCLRNLWLGITALSIIGLPFMVWSLYHNNFENHEVAWFVAGLFVLLTVPITLFGVVLHLNNFNRPEVQRYVIRILFMAPIYSVNCWFALKFKDSAIYIDTARECYEAFVIYSFCFFLLNTVGADSQDVIAVLEAKPPMRHMLAFRWLKPWRMGEEFYKNCRSGVLFYTLARILCSIAAFFLEVSGNYGEGDFSPEKGYVWITLINNVSQVWAMYCLALVYYNLKEELAGIRPLPKFICIKLVVFFSFWQSVGIALLVRLKVIKENPLWTDYNADDVSKGLQDFIICIEMFFAAVGHHYYFSHEEYKVEEKPDLSCCQKIKSLLDVSDVGGDMYHHIRDVGGVVVKPVTVTANVVARPFRKRTESENSGILGLKPEDQAPNDNSPGSDGGYTPPQHVVPSAVDPPDFHLQN